MKRLWFLPLALLLFLTACGGEEEAEFTPEEQGGRAIVTDWSKLTPYQATEPLYTRWYEDYTDRLIPLEGGYGSELIPFAGLRIYSDWPAADGCLHGLMTKDGVIVADPVFTSVMRPQYWVDELVNLPFLRLEKSGVAIGAEGELLHQYAVAAIDGSWCTEFQYYATFAGPEHMFLTGAEGCEVLALDGSRTPYTWEELGFYDGACPYWAAAASMDSAPVWVEGKLILESFPDGWRMLDLATGEVTTVTVEGGHQENYHIYFGEGLTSFQKDGLYGMVNIRGEWVIPPRYQHDLNFYQGYAQGQLPNGRYVLLDPSGKELLNSACQLRPEVWEEGVYFLEMGYENDEQTYERVFDQNLQEVKTFEGMEPNWVGGGWFWDKEGGRLLRGDAVIPLPKACRGANLYISTFDEFVLIRYKPDGSGNPVGADFVLSHQGDVLYTAPERAILTECIDPASPTPYLHLFQEGLISLLTLEGEVLISGRESSWGTGISAEDGLLCKQTPEATEFYTPEGELFFRYPIWNHAGD